MSWDGCYQCGTDFKLLNTPLWPHNLKEVPTVDTYRP
jgi:hypothetical protein